ncbi:hypothetical protein CRUP_033795 [Coryphaenoides rupestris]|nr:hypothetical protein CRUP_033795 [Coryphaenoides rupestris]
MASIPQAQIEKPGSNKSKRSTRYYTDVHGLPCNENIVRSAEDTPEVINTKISGTISEWISGNFLRNGPGKFEIGNQTFNHWFDGMALLHQFKISNGQVTYRSRFLSSECYQANSEHNHIMVSEFGTVTLPDPCKNFFQRFLSRFELPKATDNASVSFVTYKGDYYVSTETNFMHKVDLETLETTKKVDWSKFIAVNGATAHPHNEPDGTTYNMGNSYTSKEETLEGATIVCSIPSTDKTKPSYYHSFAMSKNYVVFIEQPIKMNLLKIVTGRLTGKSISESVSSVKYHTKAMSTFHQINAYEENGFLVMDMCVSDDGQAINNYMVQNLRKSGEALDEVYNTMCRVFPRRFVLPLHVGTEMLCGTNLNSQTDSTATAIKISNTKELHIYGGLEFPQINYAKYNTQPYRYFYGCGFRHLVGDSLIKIDLQGKQMKDKSTFLLVLDAKTFQELGRAEVPVNIPYGFHGTFNATA